MTLLHIAVFYGAALVYRWLIPARARSWALLAGSILAIYWLQPVLPVRQMDFWLPTATILIAIAGWAITRTAQPFTRTDYLALGLTSTLIITISATRYLIPELRLTSRPPAPPNVAVFLIAGLLITWGLWRLSQRSNKILLLMGLFVVLLFILSKYEPLTLWLSGLLRSIQGQDPALASSTELGWLGFSYVAFRIIHTLRDRQTGQLPPLNLREYLTYIIFFPAFTAGPIDRAERFHDDLTQLNAPLANQQLIDGSHRVLMGLFKKFVLADTLAIIALNEINAYQVNSTVGAWVLLYAYALRLFLDFSGYTDIAIGIAQLSGIHLPENFNRPYTRNNITTFWQSWHMTLSNWVRFYVFSPLSRSLLRAPRRLPTPLILLISHLATMVIIGLWHGITTPFLIWGLWHGIGLFIHKQWSDQTRNWYRQLQQRATRRRIWHTVGILLTFHFVVLGWVWFALPDTTQALYIFRLLAGFA